MYYRLQSVAKLLYVVTCLMLLAACGSTEGSSDGANNSNYQWPANIVGKAITFTVTEPQTAGIPAGYKITWNYGSGGQVQGHNPVTGETVAPDDYAYSKSATQAVITVNYYQYGLHAWEEFTLIPSSSTAGNYTYRADTASGQGVKTARGTYVIDSSSGTGTGTGTGGSTTTGQVAFWTKKTTTQSGSITVNIDNAYAGGLTQHFTSTPNCGDSGTLTKTLTSGSHSYSAKDGTLSWGPSSFTITAGGCLTYELR